jgi:hypothetical protein
LKFLIQSTEALSSREVAGRLLKVLHAIVSIKAPIPNIVYDMNNHPLRNFSLDNASNFEKYLNIDTIETHLTHRKPNSYWIIFNLTTSMTLTAIRRHDVVNNVIVGLKGRVSLYPWSNSDRDVVSIGFVIGAIPRYQMSDHFSNHLRTTIAKTCKTKRVPPFKCVLSRISAQYRGRSVSCEAFDIQVRRVEVDKVVGLACKALPAQGNQSIMLYSDQYINPDRFAAAVMLQAKHQEAHRIVVIKGIPDSEMFRCPSSFTTGISLILDRFGSFQVVASTLRVNESASYEAFVVRLSVSLFHIVGDSSLMMSSPPSPN